MGERSGDGYRSIWTELRRVPFRQAWVDANGVSTRYAEAGPGDFIYVPPYVPHQEINASDTEPLECVLVRSDNEAVAINIDVEPVEKPEEVYWVDPTHPHPHQH